MVSCAAGVAIGAADLSIGTVVEAIAGRLGVGAGTDLLTTHIVVDLRLPRVLAAALVGAGLALCGAVLQSLTVTRSPTPTSSACPVEPHSARYSR